MTKLTSRLLETQRIYKTTLTGGKYVDRNKDGNVVALALYGDELTKENIRLAADMPNLQRLELACPDVEAIPLTASDLAPLTQTRNLRELYLLRAFPHLTENICLSISRLKSVTYIETDYCVIAPTGFAHLVKMRSLKQLVINVWVPAE